MGSREATGLWDLPVTWAVLGLRSVAAVPAEHVAAARVDLIAEARLRCAAELLEAAHTYAVDLDARDVQVRVTREPHDLLRVATRWLPTTTRARFVDGVTPPGWGSPVFESRLVPFEAVMVPQPETENGFVDTVFTRLAGWDPGARVWLYGRT